MAQSVEAVIISGPRRGEIVKLPREQLPTLSDQEIEQLNAGLDAIIAAIDRLSAEFRTNTETFKMHETTD